MRQLIFASKNSGKIREIREIFSSDNFSVGSLLDMPDIPEIIEDGKDFEQNAKIKAAKVFDAFHLPVIADDSGIVVDQLEGRPGIYSARFAGDYATDDDNNKRLLEELSSFPEPHTARYICCSVYYDALNYFCEYGEIEGTIVNIPRGYNGFGYDPYFIPNGYNRTMAELNPGEKNRISHRGKAFNKLREVLRQII